MAKITMDYFIETAVLLKEDGGGVDDMKDLDAMSLPELRRVFHNILPVVQMGLDPDRDWQADGTYPTYHRLISNFITSFKMIMGEA